MGSPLDVPLDSLVTAEGPYRSAGYGVAFEDGAHPRHEGMTSLKVLK